MKKYTVAGEYFTSKDGIQKRAREIAERHEPGSSLSGQDFLFIFDLLKMHSEANEKIGCGVKSIEIEIEPVWKTKAFYVTRTDGSRTDFSTRNCSGVAAKETPYYMFSQAARNAIAKDVMSAKIKYFGGKREVLCEVTKERINFSSAHVDHAPPYRFKNIVDEYISSRKIDLGNVLYISSGDMQVSTVFANKDIEKDFVEFHNQLAKLRIVSGKWNMSAEAKK